MSIDIAKQAPRVDARPLRAGATGDSTTAGDLRSTDGVLVAVGTVGPMDNMSQMPGPRSWFTHACAQSGGRLLHVYNDAQASDRTPAMLARFPALLARGLDVVFLGDAHNDFSTGSGITEAQTRSNIDQMVKLAQQAGVEPILTTAYPDNNTAVYYAPIKRHNQWLKQYAATNRILLIDKFAATVDPNSTSATWQSAYQLDGTHASYTGAKVAGQYVVNALSTLLRGGPTFLPADSSFGVNRLPGGLFAGSATNGVGANWNLQGAGVTATIATDAAVLGKVQQLTVASASMNFYQNATVDGTNLRVGDRVKWAGLVKADAAAGSMWWWMDMTMIGATVPLSVRPLGSPSGAYVDMGWTYYECEAVIPAGTTQVRVGAYTNGGTGTLYLAQQGLYDMSLALAASTTPF